MALPSSGAISFLDLKTEFKDTNPVRLNEFYAGGGLVPPGSWGVNGAIPSAGQIDLNAFHGAAGSLLGGAKWIRSASTYYPDYTSNICGQGTLVGVSGSYICSSSDSGMTWTRQSMVGTMPLGYVMEYLDGYYWDARVITDGSGTSLRMLTSSDGVNWSIKVGGIAANSNVYGLCKGTVAHVPRHVLLHHRSSGTYPYYATISTDLWTTVSGSSDMAPLTPGTANTLLFVLGVGLDQGGDGLFICGGYTGFGVGVSPNGTNWQSRPVMVGGSATYPQIGSIAHDGATTIVATDLTGHVILSTDGMTYTQVATLPNASGSASYYRVAYGNGYWVIAGPSNLAAPNNFWTWLSTDGTSWTRCSGIELSGAMPQQLLYTGSNFVINTTAGIFYAPG